MKLPLFLLRESVLKKLAERFGRMNCFEELYLVMFVFLELFLSIAIEVLITEVLLLPELTFSITIGCVVARLRLLYCQLLYVISKTSRSISSGKMTAISLIYSARLRYLP